MKPRLVPRHPGFGLFVILISGIAASSYFLERPRQSVYESKAASHLVKWWSMHEALHPDIRITNTTQLFAELPAKYPYWLHEQLRVFGKHAGFERSVGEKYVIIWPPLSTRSHGDMILVTARPYPARVYMKRTGISMVGNHYQVWEMREERLQTLFGDDNRTIPVSDRLPPPPSPPANVGGPREPFWTGLAGQFSKLEWRGIPPAHISIIRKTVYGFGMGGVVLVLGFCFWPVTVIDLPRDDLEGSLGRAEKITTVTISTIIITLFALAWVAQPGCNKAEFPYHVLFPYAMLWQSGPFLVVCAVLQFPLYGWVIGRAWVRDEIVVGFAIIMCPHVIALLLSVATAVAKYAWAR